MKGWSCHEDPSGTELDLSEGPWSTQPFYTSPPSSLSFYWFNSTWSNEVEGQCVVLFRGSVLSVKGNRPCDAEVHLKQNSKHLYVVAEDSAMILNMNVAATGKKQLDEAIRPCSYLCFVISPPPNRCRVLDESES